MQITINIDGKDYMSTNNYETAKGVVSDERLRQIIFQDWGDLTGFFLVMAEAWMMRMERTACQICYNQGNGAIAVGKIYMFPNARNPYEEDEEVEDIWEELRGAGLDKPIGKIDLSK